MFSSLYIVSRVTIVLWDLDVREGENIQFPIPLYSVPLVLSCKLFNEKCFRPSFLSHSSLFLMPELCKRWSSCQWKQVWVKVITSTLNSILALNVMLWVKISIIEPLSPGTVNPLFFPNNKIPLTKNLYHYAPILSLLIYLSTLKSLGPC